MLKNYIKDRNSGNVIPWWIIRDKTAVIYIFSAEYDNHYSGRDLIILHYQDTNCVLYQLKKKSSTLWLYVYLLYNIINISTSRKI